MYVLSKYTILKILQEETGDAEEEIFKHQAYSFQSLFLIFISICNENILDFNFLQHGEEGISASPHMSKSNVQAVQVEQTAILMLSISNQNQIAFIYKAQYHK